MSQAPGLLTIYTFGIFNDFYIHIRVCVYRVTILKLTNSSSSTDFKHRNKYMLSRCELIDTENIASACRARI